MSDTESVPQSTPISFPEVALLKTCTGLRCKNGHIWTPTVALARCGYNTPNGWNGCGTPILAVKMESCRMCNEPMVALRMRIDITPPVPYPVPMCIPGSAGNQETIEIEIPLKHAAQSEAKYESALDEVIKEHTSDTKQEGTRSVGESNTEDPSV